MADIENIFVPQTLWNCPQCTYENVDKNRYCEICGYKSRIVKRKSPPISNFTSSASHLPSQSLMADKPKRLSNECESPVILTVTELKVPNTIVEDNTEIVNKKIIVESQIDNDIAVTGNGTIAQKKTSQHTTTPVHWECTCCTYKNHKKDRLCCICGNNRDSSTNKLNKIIQEQAERVQGSRIEQAVNLNNRLAPSSQRGSLWLKWDESAIAATPNLSLDEQSSVASSQTSNSRVYFQQFPPLKRGMIISWSCFDCDKDYTLRDSSCSSCLSLQKPPYFYLPLSAVQPDKASESKKIHAEYFDAAMVIADDENDEVTASSLVAALIQAERTPTDTPPIAVDCLYPRRSSRIGPDYQVDSCSIPSLSETECVNQSSDCGLEDAQSRWQKDNEHYEVVWIPSPTTDNDQMSMCNSYLSGDVVVPTTFKDYSHRFASYPITALHALYKANYDITAAFHSMKIIEAQHKSHSFACLSTLDDNDNAIGIISSIMKHSTGRTDLDNRIIELDDAARRTFRIGLIKYGDDSWNKLAVSNVSYYYDVPYSRYRFCLLFVVEITVSQIHYWTTTRLLLFHMDDSLSNRLFRSRKATSNFCSY